MKSANFSVLFLFYTVQRADAYVKLQLKVKTEYGREYERIDRKATYIIQNDDKNNKIVCFDCSCISGFVGDFEKTCYIIFQILVVIS